MKIASWNVNGIRSVWQKGFERWMRAEEADVICLQEIKADKAVLEGKMLEPMGYQSHWHCAEKKGYSGVAIYSKKAPRDLQFGIGDPEIDREGRVLTAEFDKFVLVNAYFPNSQRDHARLSYKLKFCSKIFRHLEGYRAGGKNLVLCGDINIAHREIDLKNPKQNLNNAGFLPEERAWMDGFLSQPYVDTFRVFNQEPGHYTWWSYRPTIRSRDIGWRLDYFFANAEFKDRLKAVTHRKKVKGSDHCPIVLELR